MKKGSEQTHTFWNKELTPYRILKICTLLIASIFLFMSWGHGFFWVNAILWAVIVVFFFSVKLPVMVSLVIVTAGIIVSLFISLSAQNNMAWEEYVEKVRSIQTINSETEIDENSDAIITPISSPAISPEIEN